MRRLIVVAATLAAGVALFLTATALSADTNCAVNASGGYANCLTVSNPSSERVKSWSANGRPYHFQLWRQSTGSLWGWWAYNDDAYHSIPLSLSGAITGQVDNMGTGNPSSYYVQLN